MMRYNIFYLVCAALHHPSDGSRLHLQETHQVLFSHHDEIIIWRDKFAICKGTLYSKHGKSAKLS